MNINNIQADGETLAVVVRHSFIPELVEFPTPQHFPLQLGIHQRAAHSVVEAHSHKPFENITIPAQEFFYVVEGKVKVVLFHGNKEHSTVILDKGDMIVLNCGHEITFLEKTKLIEIKQGPYRGKSVEKVFLK